jgi:hypothetical protein
VQLGLAVMVLNTCWSPFPGEYYVTARHAQAPEQPCYHVQIPTDLGVKYGKMILEADGFAQVFPEHKVGGLGGTWRYLSDINQPVSTPYMSVV